MQYRSRIEIIGAMLRVIGEGGANKTKIMYKAYMSYKQLSEYLTLVLARGFVEYDESEKTYRLTVKGAEVGNSIENIGEMLDFDSVNLAAH